MIKTRCLHISLHEPAVGSNPVAIVSDADNEANAFFYDQNVSLNDQVYKSLDGLVWAQVSSTPTKDVDPDTYKSAFLTHCAGNDCTDELGQHVPDGVMSAPGAITAKPLQPPIINYVQGTHSFSFSSGDPSDLYHRSHNLA